jgi:hypothetical protein
LQSVSQHTQGLISVKTMVDGRQSQFITNPNGVDNFGVREGSKLEFQITNVTDYPVMVHIGVDGMSTMYAGKFDPNLDCGIIIPPRGLRIINCFRFDNQSGGEIRATLGGRTPLVDQLGGNAVMAGIVEIAVFKQKQQLIRTPQFTNLEAYSFGAGTQRNDDQVYIGKTPQASAFVGDTIQSPVTPVNFVRSCDTPDQEVTIYYSDLNLLLPYISIYGTRPTSFGQTRYNHLQQR